jgi:cyclopropane-fatty-acyl-phospholipid synthase
MQIENHIPVLGDINFKSPFAYQATFGVVKTVNIVQMAVAE